MVALDRLGYCFAYFRYELRYIFHPWARRCCHCCRHYRRHYADNFYCRIEYLDDTFHTCIAAWFKWFRQNPVTESGQSNYRLDTLGTVIEDIQPHSRGKVTFDTPVLGNTSWHATSKIDIDKNTRVKIVQINGQLIEVEPLHNARENNGSIKYSSHLTLSV